MKYIRIALSVILIVTISYIILGEAFMPANVPKNGMLCDVLPGDSWSQVLEDGTRVPFSVPGTADSDIVLETTLPQELDRDASVLCFRGMDMRIFVGGELRTEYVVEDYPLLGDRSAECYVCVPIYPGDAGKKITVEYSYNSGMVYEVYIGTRFGILAQLFSYYGAELLVGLAILILGIISFVASTVYRIIHKQYLEMQHLSLGTIIGALWVLSNSVFRQLFTRNISVMSDIPFLMVIIMPLPFLIFINSMQKGRHSRIIIISAVIEIVDFIVCITLFVTGIRTLTQTFPLAALCALFSIVSISITIILDARRHLLWPYRFVAAGFIFLGITAIVQILIFQFAHNGVFSGLFMAIGLFGFLICAIIHTIKQLIGIRIDASEARLASKAKDDFLANMSHEIRTPLNGILGMDEMIIRDTRDARIKRYALDIKSAGNTLLSLINDILDLSKIQAGEFEIVPIEYGLASVLNDVINITKSRAAQKNLEYEVSVAEDLPSGLYGDEIRIRQVMLNIINNAIKYTEEGKISIRVSGEDRKDETLTLVIRVRDTGIGIREEDREKLFRSFQRLDEQKNYKVEGTGLGLHITWRLVELMGGRIEVDSVYGKGSEFQIYVPQSISWADPIGDFGRAINEHMNEMEAEETTLYAPDARVLVVDDNEMNLEVMEGLLRDTKVKVDLADSGMHCIEMAEKQSYDCILLDQMMPEMNGEQTLKELMKRDLSDKTPVIALTADAIVGAKENYLTMGFSDYISKPVKYDHLEQVLKKHLPKEKLLVRPEETKDLPTILLWGTDPVGLRAEKERLEGIYKCVCVTGKPAMEKYLKKHQPDLIMEVMPVVDSVSKPTESAETIATSPRS
ncbi:MAG: response regulator [Lachnospiraceae bacterium]|nr:response regulator [Lachnospiraceae bacterium]